MGPAPVIDAHVHIFPPEIVRDRTRYLERDARFGALYSLPKARLATAEELLTHMDGAGVAVSVVAGFPFSDQGLCRLLNDYLIDTVAAYPGRLAGLACVAPDAPGAVQELERCLEAGLRGCGELAPEEYTPGLGEVAGCLVERDVPLLVHASEPVGHEYPGKGVFTPGRSLVLAQAHPGLAIVLAHMGGGLFLYESMPEVRRILVDVCYDTAAVPYVYGPAVYQAAVASAGPEKLIFGSDYPLLPAEKYREGLDKLPADQRPAIEGGNARRVFKL